MFGLGTDPQALKPCGELPMRAEEAEMAGKRFSIGKGVTLNIGKHGTSITTRSSSGTRITTGPRGTRVTFPKPKWK
jgi:hypothetical protein